MKQLMSLILVGLFVMVFSSNALGRDFLDSNVHYITPAEENEFCAQFKKAEQGDAIAQNKVGVYYMDGKGVAKNMQEAVSWFIKSSKQGFGPAEANLGALLINVAAKEAPNKVEADRYTEEGLALLMKAADKKLGQAYHTLGVYYNQKGDADKAKDWWTKGAKLENGSCIFSLKGISMAIEFK